jgi:serine/threonine-protein kinase
VAGGELRPRAGERAHAAPRERCPRGGRDTSAERHADALADPGPVRATEGGGDRVGPYPTCGAAPTGDSGEGGYAERRKLGASAVGRSAAGHAAPRFFPVGAGAEAGGRPRELPMTRSAVAFVVAACIIAGEAHAEPSTHAVAAEELFRAGRELLGARRFKEACEKLDASEKLDPAVGTLFSLGECYSGAGRTASAWFAYRTAIAVAAQRGDARREAAEARAAAIEPLLSSLVVRVGLAAGVRVAIDGEPFADEVLRAPVVVDPGAHVIVASADGFLPWTSRVEVRGPAERMPIDVPPLEPVPDPSVALKAEEARRTRRTYGFALGGAGLVALGVGAALGAEAIAKGRDANRACPSTAACADVEAVHENDTAKGFADASTVLIPVGVVLAGIGGYLLWTARAPRAPEITASLASSGGRVGVSWAW